MKKLICLLSSTLILCLLLTLVARADMVYLRDGKEYKGKLENINTETVSFKIDESGELKELTRASVLRIEVAKKRPGDDASKLDALHDKLLSSLVNSTPGQKEHPQAGYLTLHEEVNIVINPDRSATQTRRITRKMLRERGLDAAGNNSLTYLANRETLTLDFARTVDPEGNLYHISDNAIEDGSPYLNTPEYENLHRLKFALPEVKVGAIIDYQLTRTIKKIDVLTPWVIQEYLQYQEPLLKKVVRVTVPKEFELSSRVVRSNERVTAEVKEQKNTRTYTWTVTEAPLMERPEPNMPPGTDIVPKLVASLKNTPDQIGQAYLRVLENNFKVDSTLRRKVMELTKDKTGATAKARALYNYVTKEIKYIPVSPTEYGYLPKKLDLIFRSKKGNSLDKTYLFYGLLRIAGFQPSFLWVRSQSAGQYVEGVTSLGQFTTPLVKINGQEYHLNPSLDTVPFNILVSSLQNVRGLEIERNSIKLITTPLTPTTKESVSNKYEIDLRADGTIKVTKNSTFNGGHAIGVRGLKDLKPDELNKQIQSIVNGIHPNARLIDYRISNLKDLNQPVNFTINYEIKDYALKAGESLLALKLPEIDYTAFDVGRTVRNYPLDWDSCTTESNEITVKIPAGYRVYYRPENYSFQHSTAIHYQARFKEKDQTIIFTDNYTRQVITLAIKDYPQYKKCLETKAALAKEWIVLEKTENR